tara:strand:- start:693 stop:923 length:231 start_codon:yes stop_codon:yes gene_type:complete
VSKKKTNDTGSAESQITLFTNRINEINDHLKIHKKDNSSRRGLMIMVSKRRRLLKYLKKRKLDDYTSLIKKLNIRK